MMISIIQVIDIGNYPFINNDPSMHNFHRDLLYICCASAPIPELLIKYWLLLRAIPMMIMLMLMLKMKMMMMNHDNTAGPKDPNWPQPARSRSLVLSIFLKYL